MENLPGHEASTAGSVLEQEIQQYLGRLSIAQQHQVLDFARALSSARPRGVAGRQLLQFVGAIEPDDLTLISQAIADDCENIQIDEW